MNNYEYEEELKLIKKDDEIKQWGMAFGLQKVDYLEPSSYMVSLAEENIEGNISLDEIEQLLYQYYGEDLPEKIEREREADLVSTRIKKLLSSDGFALNPGTLKSIHRFLFKDIYPEWAGEYRDKNLTKKEPILGNETVKYANYFMIEDTLAYDFGEERKVRYSQMRKDEIVERISKFTSSIWQVHPFREGNTRTTAVFIERYLNSLGFDIDNEPFKENALYFRNALVRSNYADYKHGIDSTDVFLQKFFDNALFGAEHKLSNREMIVGRQTSREFQKIQEIER